MAVNPHKGEFELHALGQTFRGKIGMHAFTIIEDRTGQNFLKFFEAMAIDGSARDVPAKSIVTLLAATLNQYHPELTDKAVCDIIDELDPADIAAALEPAVKSSLARATKGAAANGTDDPPTVPPSTLAN